MGVIKDLTGQKFGKLLVIEKTPERKNRQVVWKCQCDCGNITYVVGQALRSGHTQSCGCSHFEKNKAEDLTGKKFGKLTVINRNMEKKTKNRLAFWNCICECGNERIVSSSELRLGQITQCHACAQKNKKLRDPNSYIGPIKNRIGERFGKLTVIEDTGKRENGKVVWKCQCDCGNFCEVSSNSLITGNTKSCGCLRHTSIGEDEIEQILKNNNIPYIKQPTFSNVKDKIVLRYDFGIINECQQIIRLVEFDGEQHYYPIDYFGGEEGYIDRVNKDKIKNEGAQNMNIPLVRIPYTIRNNIDLSDILGDNYLVKL